MPYFERTKCGENFHYIFHERVLLICKNKDPTTNKTYDVTDKKTGEYIGSFKTFKSIEAYCEVFLSPCGDGDDPLEYDPVKKKCLGRSNPGIRHIKKRRGKL